MPTGSVDDVEPVCYRSACPKTSWAPVQSRDVLILLISAKSVPYDSRLFDNTDS